MFIHNCPHRPSVGFNRATRPRDKTLFLRVFIFNKFYLFKYLKTVYEARQEGAGDSPAAPTLAGFSSIGRLAPLSLSNSERRNHRESIARFGWGLHRIEPIARSLS